MIRFEVSAIRNARTYEFEADESIPVKELSGYMASLCHDSICGILLSMSGKGRLPDEGTLLDYGVSSGDRLMYISCKDGKGGYSGTVKCGVCTDEGAA